MLAAPIAALVLLAAAACGSDDTIAGPTPASGSPTTVISTPTSEPTGTESSSIPLSPYEDEPTVKVMRRWAVILGNGVPVADLSGLRKVMAGQALSATVDIFSSDYGNDWPGPQPFTPARVRSSGRSATVDFCFQTKGWSLNPKTHQPVARKRQIASDDVGVVMVGFGEHLVDLETGRARQVKHLDDVLGELSTGAASSSEALRRLGVHGVRQGRQRGATQAAKPVAILLSGAPTSTEAQALAALTAGGRTPVSVVSVGDSPSARWRFTVDAQGGFSATALGLTGQARRLDPAAQHQLRELMEVAAASRAAGEEAFASHTPAELAAAALAATPVSAPTPGVADGGGDVTVRFLGEVTVDGATDVPAERRMLVTDVVALVALHPEGLHDAVLRSSLWPRGVEDDVVSDLAVLAAAARHIGADELDGLLDALRQGTGEIFGGDTGTRAWLAFPARQARVLVASAARRTAELAVAASRIDDATEALRLEARACHRVPDRRAGARTLSGASVAGS